jgi:translocator protein
MITRHPVARLIIALILCLSTGYADLYFFIPAIPAWYGSLSKPPFIPNVSIIYYGLIVVSLLLAFCLYSLWNVARTNKEARLAVWLFVVGLFLNVAWFFTFFWARSAFFSMAVMALLLTVVIATMFQSMRAAVITAVYQVPYFIILVAITYANVMIYLMNPGLPLIGIAL